MKIITKYILKQMLLGFVLVTTGLLMIVWLSQSLRLLDMLLNSKASVWLFIRMTMLMVPGYLSTISPLALFAVALFTYNRMIADRELIILRAAGMSPVQLAKPVFILGTVFTLIGFYISLIVVPNAVTSFRELRWKVQNDVSHLLLQEGEFNDVSFGITVYIRSRNDDNSLEGIILHDQRSRSSRVTLLAEKGAITYRNGVPQISMFNGSRQEVAQKTGRFSILYFDFYNLDFSTLNKQTFGRLKNRAEMGLFELLNITIKDVLTEKNVREYKVEAYKRLALPFYNLSFMLIAAVGLLTGSFNRRGHTKRVIWTVIVMALLQMASLGAENLSVRSLGFVPLIYFFAIAPIFICIYILKNAGTFSFDTFKKGYAALLRLKDRLIVKRSARAK